MGNQIRSKLDRRLGQTELTEIGRDVVMQERQIAHAGRRTRDDTVQSRAGMIVTQEDRDFVSELLRETMEAYMMPKVKNDDELLQRLQDYFTRCSTRGIVPTIEEMILYCGYTNSWMYDITSGRNKGFTPQTSLILKKAKHFMHSLDTKLVESGKLNFLAYCFRAKNYYGMTDKSEVVLTPNQQQEEYSADEIRKRYLPVDDASGDPIEID